MAVHLVSYDLNRRKEYTRLITRIKQYTHAQVLYSQWLVQTDLTPKQLGDDLINYMDADDGILVSEMIDSVVWRNLMIPNETMQKWVNAARTCR